MSRRTLLGLAAAGASAAMLAAAAPPRALASTPVQPLPQPATLEGFSLPTKATAPRFRWWWPNGEVDIDEIRREVQQVAENGFGGLEVANVHHSVPGEVLDVENLGWGSPQWIAALEAALEAGAEHGVEIDVTLGPSWPAAIPTITPQDPAALVELVHGQVELTAGQRISGELPEPVVEPKGGVSGKQLLAVHAVQIASRGEKNVLVLRRSSLVDLTSTVSGTKIDWTAPDDGGEWILLAYWQRGMGQVAEGGPHTSPESYVVDHFSRAGADALIAYWEKNILNSRVRDLLSRTGGTFFEDSLEIETHATIWTRAMQTEFSSRIGYDLMPFLPVLLEINERYTFEFDDIKSHRVRDDFNLVLSQLYTDHHLVPLRDWSHSFGLEYRVQAYGLEQDSLEQAGIVDIIETESLGAKNLDDYRVLASGRDIAGRTIMSCEAAAYLGKSYSSTWNEVLNTLGETFAGGVNQTVLHGFAYAKAPGSQWPGFAAFTPCFNNAVGYSEAWGPRMPVWGAPQVGGRLPVAHAVGAASGPSQVRRRLLPAEGLGPDRHRGLQGTRHRHRPVPRTRGDDVRARREATPGTRETGTPRRVLRRLECSRVDRLPRPGGERRGGGTRRRDSLARQRPRRSRQRRHPRRALCTRNPPHRLPRLLAPQARAPSRGRGRVLLLRQREAQLREGPAGVPRAGGAHDRQRWRAHPLPARRVDGRSHAGRCARMERPPRAQRDHRLHERSRRAAHALR
ncbi:glycosyl hydrolase [Pseudoclavibacter helvolus]|uniref:Alpha-L-rhamnosidase n=1 Tax=Pseudoclavibacter helvolus TaxID=255205 RepID=A0A7W4YHU6_9MICO|nr:glycosyl hydrolase [Pseudoclavibacter helvolus]MBB2959375.1 hypothetical protein [Pseudoclavibacter helvolus]